MNDISIDDLRTAKQKIMDAWNEPFDPRLPVYPWEAENLLQHGAVERRHLMIISDRVGDDMSDKWKRRIESAGGA